MKTKIQTEKKARLSGFVFHSSNIVTVKLSDKRGFTMKNLDNKNQAQFVGKILDKITLEEIFAYVAQAEALNAIDAINVPCISRSGDYSSFHAKFDKFSGSRSRCFCTGFFKFSFQALAEAEAQARGTKLSKADIVNLHERLAQVLKSFFATHAKNNVRLAYKNEFQNYLRNYKV